MSSLIYWLWLSSLKGIGSVTARRLTGHFGSPEDVYNAGLGMYHGIAGIGAADIHALSDKSTATAEKILADCVSHGYQVLTQDDPGYPERLRNIYDPPVVLYVRGSLPVVDDAPVVAVAGTRKCTPYGISAAESLGYKLARHGYIVVTGLAKGVDSAATRGALRGGGRVIGVIGSGLDVVYPPENRVLFDDTAAAGAIISEYPPGTQPSPGQFPARNRILSGLSLGVAIIEAPKHSGALITAAKALEQGRDVFSVPGNVDAVNCEGSNALLREGAIPVLSGDDIIAEYAGLFPDMLTPEDDKKEIDNETAVEYIDLDKILCSLDGDERTVAGTIGHNTLKVDDIISVAGFSVQQVQSALTMLEIKGYAERVENGRWKLIYEK